MSPIQTPVLSVRGLSKNFGALAVVQGVDLDLEKGARVGLIGPNGAGKTTLVNLLTGMIRADAGSILLDGVDIRHMRPEVRVRRGLARTHQINTLLVENTARENVAVAVAERDGIAWRALRFGARWRACLEEADARLSEMGISEAADRQVSELAYGQQRLLEIAIALSIKPRVLMLDEPAAGVPSTETHVIHDVLDHLPPDIAILIIEHDMDVAFQLAHKMIVFHLGEIIARGIPEEIKLNSKVKEIYLGEE